MTSTASSIASRIRDVRQIDAISDSIPSSHDADASGRIAARLERYASDAPATSYGPARAHRTAARTQAAAPGAAAQAAGSGSSALVFDDALRQSAEETSRRIEAAIAAAVDGAVQTLRNDIFAGTADQAWLQPLRERLEALEAASAVIARSVSAAVDERLDAVDDHLADLTRTLTRHPGWDVETGISHLQNELATLTQTVCETAVQQIPEDVLLQVIRKALQETPQLARQDIESSVTQPVLAAIDAAVTRLAAHPQRAAPVLATADQAATAATFAHAVRDELATVRAGQIQDIRQVETRLGALQDSVVELTEQLRMAREATEQADSVAHANALAVAGSRATPTYTPARAQTYNETPARSHPVMTEAAARVAPALPRTAQLQPLPTPSPAEIKSRFINAARRANVTPNDGPDGPAAPAGAWRKPGSVQHGTGAAQRGTGAAQHGKGAAQRNAAVASRKLVASWLRGKGLLWAAAAVIIAGAVPLLAPALRALPGALLQPPADNGSPATAASTQVKIGSHLTTSVAHAASIVDDPAALYALGDRIAEGALVGSPKLAASLLEKAAERGQAPAQYRIARLYEKGAGVPKDAQRARAWYARAADQGNVRSMHNLAVLYANGSIGAADYAAATSWFRKAAERGLSDSQYNLGVLLARGLGGPMNAKEAWVWFDIGARNGDLEAAARREELAANLTPDVLADARDAAKIWRPTPVNAIANDPAAVAAPQPDATAGAGPTKPDRPV